MISSPLLLNSRWVRSITGASAGRFTESSTYTGRAYGRIYPKGTERLRRSLLCDNHQQMKPTAIPGNRKSVSTLSTHFKCNLKRIVDYPNIWGFTCDICQTPGIADTVNMTHIKRHYYESHLHINPFGIVPDGRQLTSHRHMGVDQ